ncbi:TetR family transcriptional regulator [Streptomyces sp. CB03238]|uniref:TetR/AcrR family transcriptional regulator n=1 Tax=Streptomyces sp. CB03238 TaxID=1907777 RepID=UPI000A115223|nr:TetR family transcriptional regulator [Streptomyces sp. CB03238]ORT61084.1 TetR family transcriptional regulator [Streptomyces sp. CB03238]
MAAEFPAPLDPLTRAHRPMGLRERKKLKTRIAIRRATYRLIAEQGYEATTVEQIAEAAEVSPSTVFRYFPAKEDIVLTDEYDPVMEEALRGRPAGEDPLESLRSVLTRTVAAFLEHEPEETRQRARLLVEVPAVRARMTETMAETSQVLSRVLADRTGRAADDLEVRVFTAAVTGALREVLIHWAERDQRDDLVALVNRALDTLKGGPSL